MSPAKKSTTTENTNDGLENIRFMSSENVPLMSLANYVKNPRKGNVRAIAESLFVSGQYKPLTLWTHQNGKKRAKPEILAGNHTWKGAVFLDAIARGEQEKPQWLEKLERKLKKKNRPWPIIAIVTIDATPEEARTIVLADNRTADLGGYDPTALKELLASAEDAYGTGFTEEEFALVTQVSENAANDMLANMRDADAEGDDTTVSLSDIIASAGQAQFGETAQGETPDFGDAPSEPEEVDEYDKQLAEMQGIISLKDDMTFNSNDYWGIPALRTDMLMDVVPSPMDTWGGKDATPDDGKTTWLWNYGATSASGLPLDRAILCFFTYDGKFEGWWSEPSFYTAKALNGGIKYAVVPDFSFYDNMTRTEMLFGVHRAQWLGRYFQEAGMKVAPRIQFSLTDPETLKFNLFGIPKGAPVIFTSQQNMENGDHEKLVAANLTKQVNELECGTIVVYGGNPAKRVSEMLKVGNTNVVHLMNVAGKRRDIVYGKKEGLQAKGLKRLKKGRSNANEESADEE